MATRQLARSISFSGAGFYGSYHLGVTSALQSHGFLPKYAELPPDHKDDIIFMGSSAGSLTAAATLTGFKVEDMMNINYELTRKTYHKSVNSLTPGYDLLCELEPFVKHLMNDVDETMIEKRINQKLHVHLTYDLIKNRIVDEFQDKDHLLSALMLSCYIPGVTGRLFPPEESAVGRATKDINEKWGIKKTKRGPNSNGVDRNDENNYEVELEPVVKPDDGKVHSFLDGGLSRNWPMINKHTVLVSPVPIQSVVKTRHVICPELGKSSSPQTKELSSPAHGLLPNKLVRPFELPGQGVITDATVENLSLFAKMIWATESEDDCDLIFKNGYDDAVRFLQQGGAWH